MLREQRAEVEELYEERAVRLESMLEEWKTKHAALRRRFSLETEGFRRDADNIGRYVPYVGCALVFRRAYQPTRTRATSKIDTMTTHTSTHSRAHCWWCWERG